MSLKMALLSMLDVQPGSGYSLYKRFNNSIQMFWPSSHQQIYKELGELSNNALINYEEIQQLNRPDAKQYTINEKGIAELNQLLMKKTQPTKIKSPFLIKFFSAHVLTKEQRIAEINLQIEYYENILKQYNETLLYLDNMPNTLKEKYLYPRKTLLFGIMYIETSLVWLNQMKKEEDDL